MSENLTAIFPAEEVIVCSFPGTQGMPGPTGRSVEMQTSATHIQWRYVGATEWTDLVALVDLKGSDGQEVSLQTSDTHIQWRLGAGTWLDLVALDDLKGEPGSDASVTSVNIIAALGYTPADAADIPTALSDLSSDADHRTVTDTEKFVWDSKQPAGSYLIASDLAGYVTSTSLTTTLSGYSLTNHTHSIYAELSGRTGGQILTGGTDVTDTLVLKGTSGNGTLTSRAVQVKVGNNGATTAMTVLNNGNVGFGTMSPGAITEISIPDGIRISFRIRTQRARGSLDALFSDFFDANGRRGWWGWGASGNNQFSFSNEMTGGDIAFIPTRNTLFTGGNVIIGNNTGTARLTVQGAGTTTGEAFKVQDSTGAEKFKVLDNGTTTLNGTFAATGSVSGLKLGVFAYLSTPATTTITTAGTYQYIAGTFTNVIAEGFSFVSTPAIRYDSTVTQYFEIDWHASFSANSASTTVTIAIYKNGLLVGGSNMGAFCKNASELYSLSGTCVSSLATNDTIQLVITTDGTGDIITMSTFTATINEFFD